ncbi:MAG: mucoidy inhibitor MuiA family protein, partial [candidate division WOR-3 bacterium]
MPKIKKYLILSTITIFCLIGYAQINVDAKIDSVIVFSDRALIVRKAEVSLSGSNYLRFSDLSGMLDDNTIRFKAAGIRFGEITVKRSYYEQPAGRVKILKDSIQILADQEQILNNELKVQEAKENFLNSVKLTSPEIISKELTTGKISPDAWQQALSFVAEELSKVKIKQIEINHKKENLKTKLDALRKELTDLQAITENRKEILVEAEVKTPGTFLIELSYLIPYSVSWQPYYEFRAEPQTGNIEINYFAKIAQRTAEDWDRVKILLSTAAPTFIGVAPEAYPWYLSLEEYQPIKPAPAMMRQGLEVQEISAEAAKAEYQVSKTETGISLQYNLPGRVSLKSGEPAKKIMIYQGKIPAEFEYYTLPRTREIAFLKGKLKNTTDFVLLAGEVNTYVGGEFTGKTNIKTIAPEESTEISLGTDERIKVKRELIKTFVSSGGLFSKKEKKEFVYKTTIENTYNRDIDIKIIEQIPVSQHKDIKV